MLKCTFWCTGCAARWWLARHFADTRSEAPLNNVRQSLRCRSLSKSFWKRYPRVQLHKVYTKKSSLLHQITLLLKSINLTLQLRGFGLTRSWQVWVKLSLLANWWQLLLIIIILIHKHKSYIINLSDTVKLKHLQGLHTAILTSPWVSQLSASHSGIYTWPWIITHSPPHVEEADLYTSTVRTAPTNQPNVAMAARSCMYNDFRNVSYNVITCVLETHIPPTLIAIHSPAPPVADCENYKWLCRSPGI